jgi:hypothetical protein
MTVTKKKRVERAVKAFRSSTQTARDYLDMVIAVSSCTRQGDGMTWQEILDIITLTLKKGA